MTSIVAATLRGEPGTLQKDRSGSQSKSNSLSLTPMKTRTMSGADYFKYVTKLQSQESIQKSPRDELEIKRSSNDQSMMKTFIIQKKNLQERKIRPREKVNSDIVGVCDSFEYKKQFGKSNIVIASMFEPRETSREPLAREGSLKFAIQLTEGRPTEMKETALEHWLGEKADLTTAGKLQNAQRKTELYDRKKKS